jgi:hypothetical protein
MTSATLYRESADLDSLLADLDAQYPGRVRVLEVTNAREGGVFGFFARPRVGVHYELGDVASPAIPAAQVTSRHPGRTTDFADEDVLAELIDAADAADAPMIRATPRSSRQSLSAVDHGALRGPNAEFAQLLLDLAARKAAERDEVPSSVRTLETPVPVIKTGEWFPQQPERAVGHRGDLTLRRKLAEIGVPIGWVPDDAPHVYAAVETLVNRLPEAPALPNAPGQIVVVVGPADTTVRVADGIRRQLRLSDAAVWTAGCSGGQDIAGSWQASVAATAHRLSGDQCAVVAVAADVLDQGRALEIVTALQPDALWLHVDATRKPSDTRAMVREFGTPTAVFVTGAASTASPASVWELGSPVALLDERPPTRSSWAVLLLDKFADLEQ